MMFYRLGYLSTSPFNIDINFSEEIYKGSGKPSFHRLPRKRAGEPLFVEDLFMVSGITNVFITSPYSIQISYGSAFNRDPILSQVLAVLHMHFCPMEEMRELDPTMYSKEKGIVQVGLPPEELRIFPPLFDSVDFDTTL